MSINPTALRELAAFEAFRNFYFSPQAAREPMLSDIGRLSVACSSCITGNICSLGCHCPTTLPAITLPEDLETTCIPRVAGLSGARAAWVTTCPFRVPHHTISDVGLIGGGHVPMPGDVSLAHHGVRFLDALPEF